jgi:hypothetical protein
MPHPLSGHRPVVLILWILAIAAFPVWTHFSPAGWDFKIYLSAMHSLEAGHDPYADATAIQRVFHSQLALHPNATPPFSYVYSPITLPLLRMLGRLPFWLDAGVYWLCYLAGVLTQTWFGMRAPEGEERKYFAYLAPVACFFPGLLASDIILSGNIAFILYAAILVTAVVGWRRKQWRWFYLAILVASCFKAPLLSLVVIPILSARRQWAATFATAAAGLALFAVQPLIWPTLFKHYLEAVELQFSFNRDFGFSPAGLFSGFLWDHHFPYSPGSLIFFLGYAIPVFGMLLYLSRRFLAGAFTLGQWMPVLIVGVILLNPRLIEYDVAPLALPLALIGWRFLAAFSRPRMTIALFGAMFLTLNVIAGQGWLVWKLTEGPLLSVFFIAGCWNLFQLSKSSYASGGKRIEQETPIEASAMHARQFQTTMGL